MAFVALIAEQKAGRTPFTVLLAFLLVFSIRQLLGAKAGRGEEGKEKKYKKVGKRRIQ